jgi:hypothetical protein
MGLFDNILNTANNASTNASKGNGGNESVTFTFAKLPESLAELQALPEASMDTPYKTAALSLLALCALAADEEIGKEMLNFLKGPEPLTPSEISFIKDRFRDSKLVPFSYFKGAKPENNYTPDVPFTVTIFSNPYSFQNENFATLHVKSGGADSPRQFRLRLKPSTGVWYLLEQMVLVGIRPAVKDDPWA